MKRGKTRRVFFFSAPNSPTIDNNQQHITVRTHLDLLSISPSQGEKVPKRLGGVIGCKYKTSSWHLNGFPYGSNIGSAV